MLPDTFTTPSLCRKFVLLILQQCLKYELFALGYFSPLSATQN